MTKTTHWLPALAALALCATAYTPLHAAPTDTAPTAAPANPDDLNTTAPKYGTWGFDAAGEDSSVSPGADFFRFADGTWWDKEVIPADKVRYGNFDVLGVLSEARTRLLIEDAGAGHSTD